MEVIYRNTENLDPIAMLQGGVLATAALVKLQEVSDNTDNLDMDGMLEALIEFREACKLLGFLNCNDAFRWLKIYGSFDI